MVFEWRITDGVFGMTNYVDSMRGDDELST